MKKKGFTLIELLAIIVILAIIAVITVPIILNIIENSRKGAAIDSAYGYKDAINKYYITELAKNPSYNELNGTYTVNSDGSITGGGKEYSIPVSGTIPSGGKINLKNNGINEACLIINGYEITYEEGKFETNGKGDCEGMVSDEPAEPESFATDSWDTIVAAVQSGNTDQYTVGEEKEVELEIDGEKKSYTLRIANTTTPEECKSEGFSQTACGFVLEFADIITERGMNTSNTNKGGWRDSAMRKYLNCSKDGKSAVGNGDLECSSMSGTATIYDALPDALKEAIIDTRVVSGYSEKDSDNFTTTDKIYLLATAEVWENGTSNIISRDTARDNTRQLDYYAQDPKTTTDSGQLEKAIKYYGSSATWWWLRSAYSSVYSDHFFIVHGDGACNDYRASNGYGVAPAFRIGSQ